MAQPEGLVSSFSLLFYLCKFCGVYPHSLKRFRNERIICPSKLGTIIVLIHMIAVLVLYNMLIYSLTDEDKSIKAKQSTLTFVIGLFLNYIAPAMLVVDQLTAINNQGKIEGFFNKVKNVDEKLETENIFIDNGVVKNQISFMVMFTIVSEIAIMLTTYIFLVDDKKWYSFLWIISCVPTLLSVFDKIWFASLLFGLKQRFQAINNCLDHLVENHYKANWGKHTNNESQSNRDGRQHDFVNNNNNSGRSIKTGKTNQIFPKDSGVVISTSNNAFRVDSYPEKNKTEIVSASELGNIAKMDTKLTNFCQLHDEICELGKSLNELWSYPVLVLMAYGFLIFTAQLYFLYCGTQRQPIPSLFRSAKNAYVTSVYLLYTSGKCIYLIYLSWKTSLESKRTGICLHKCGVAADNNGLYEIVNHLSLKLLNHSVDFSACGFFTLDMETLYGVSGGITSYLIILIQFNLAAQQAKDAIYTGVVTYNETANLMIDDIKNASYAGLSNFLVNFGIGGGTEIKHDSSSFESSESSGYFSSSSSTTEDIFL